ncbi:MAG: hypothetical protein Q9216_000341 [Gyalolechia sp. 2 TL-2023]
MDSASSTSPAEASPLCKQSPWATATAPANGLEPDSGRPSRCMAINPKKSSSAISLRAFLIGLAFGISITLTFSALRRPSSPIWRAPFFVTTLSTFHFLEFYITALYNPPAATTSAFLLTTNGYSYNVAHTLALVECVFGNYIAARYFPEQTYLYPFDALFPTEDGVRAAWLTLGFALLLVGQGIRTLAMVHAATNFNHLIQFRKKEGHVLVTDGIYRWLRHPSYFGFFWWGLGTQIIMGNQACLIGYALVLWKFFKLRIESKCSLFVYPAVKPAIAIWSLLTDFRLNIEEEKLLMEFFGQDYVRYRDKTMVGIPLIS